MSAQLSFPVNRAAPANLMAPNLLKRPATDRTPSRSGDLSITGGVLHFAADHKIYREGDDATRFFKVVSGVVRTCKYLADGRRQIGAFHVAGDIFGVEADQEYSLSAEAVGGCTLIAYRRRGLEALAASNSELARQLFSFAVQSMARARQHALLLGRGTAIEKICSFLTQWAASATNERTITLAMTRQDIADYLGMTIETVSRTLSQLERDKVIALTTARQIRVINPAALKAANA